MNRHITIAAFLVAGAAFANAATDLRYLICKDPGAPEELTSLIDVSSYGYFWHLQDDAGVTRPSGTGNAWAGVPKTNGTTKDSEGSVYKSLTMAGNTDYNLIFSQTEAVSVLIDTAVYFNSFDVGSSVPSSFTFDFGTSGSITAKSTLNFGTEVKSEGGSIKIVASGVSAGERRLLLSTESQDGILNLTDAKNVTLSVDGYDTSLGLLTSTPQTLSAGQAALVYENKSLYLVSGIPEPSAFGLLAGLGALALVAARRRRGRKA